MASLGSATSETDWNPKFTGNIHRDLLRQFVGDMKLEPINATFVPENVTCLSVESSREGIAKAFEIQARLSWSCFVARLVLDR